MLASLTIAFLPVVTPRRLFGSLASGKVTERSDVDLAVEGLQIAGYFTALADLTGLFDSPVDLVEIERAPASLLARLQLEGRDL